MSFVGYDIFLLIAFVIFVSLFLYIKRKNLNRQGLLFLYRTKLGIKFINYVGGKYKKTLKVLSYISVTTGYLLMAGALYLIGKIVWVYVAMPQVVKAIKVPPITPLIPYIDKIVPSLPPFYFIYWIVILAVIAISHEFAHGIFMKLNKIKIKSTGFGFFPFFFPVFLAAFVEQDEKSMEQKKIFPQLAVLSAGTFANLLTAILTLIILVAFFSVAFVPAGAEFNTYSYSIVGLASITSVNGISFENKTHENFVGLLDNESLNEIKVDNTNYVGVRGYFEEDEVYVALYDDSPAINAGLEGVIIEIDGVKVTGWENFGEELMKKSPGENVSIITKTENDTLEYEITLGQNPENKELPWIGIGFEQYSNGGIIGKTTTFLTSFKEAGTYYESKGEISSFIYNLIWWMILISLSVALINMLPVGIFDGGRFFYLTILAITKNQKKAEKCFKFMTGLFLFLLLVVMIFWAASWF